MKVQNMTSRKGNKIPNQFIIDTGDFLKFQSYKTMIADKSKITGHVALDRQFMEVDRYNYRGTTMKYLSLFLDESTKEIKEKIKSGVYLLTNLN